MRIVQLFAVLVGLWFSFQLGVMWGDRGSELLPDAPSPAPSQAHKNPAERVTRAALAPKPAPVARAPPPPPAAADRPADRIAPRDLVLGLAVTQSSTKYIRRFVTSLRTYNKQARLVLCVDEATRAMLADLASSTSAVEFFVFDPARLPQPWDKYHPSNYRYWVYMQWLDTLGDSVHEAFRAALVTDVRDTVFQADPMALVPPEDRTSLHVFEEVKGRAVHKCGWNTGWIRDCFHEQAFQAVRDELILCSGTTLGAWRPVLAYITAMYTVLRTSAFCERNGIDQGVHNILIRLAGDSLSSDMYVHSHETGPVATLGMVDAADVKRHFRDGVLYNHEDFPYGILHQVDRHDWLDEALSQKYA